MLNKILWTIVAVYLVLASEVTVGRWHKASWSIWVQKTNGQVTVSASEWYWECPICFSLYMEEKPLNVVTCNNDGFSFTTTEAE